MSGPEGLSPEESPEPTSKLREIAEGAGVPQLDDAAATELEQHRTNSEVNQSIAAAVRRQDLLNKIKRHPDEEASETTQTTAESPDELREAA